MPSGVAMGLEGYRNLVQPLGKQLLAVGHVKALEHCRIVQAKQDVRPAIAGDESPSGILPIRHFTSLLGSSPWPVGHNEHARPATAAVEYRCRPSW